MATLEEQATEKERELRELRERTVLANQENIKGIENELAEERLRLAQLKADFDYNLKLLHERDEELTRYEETFDGVKRAVNSLVAENSHLKAQLADADEQLCRAREGSEEVRRQCSQRINEFHSRLQSVRSLQQAELDKERQRLRKSQYDLEQKMIDLEGDLACQRDEVTCHFEQILREREAEYETRTRDLKNSLTISEDRHRQAIRELDVCRSALQSVEEDVRGKTEELVRVEREVRERQWALEDQGSLQEGVIRDLEKRLAQTELKLSNQAEDFVQHHSELDRRLREKESVLKSAREAHSSKITTLEEQISNLTGQLEAKNSEVDRLKWQHDDSIREKQAEIERCRKEVEKCKRECRDCLEKCKRECVGRVEEVTGEVVTKDLKLQAVQDQLDQLRAQEKQLSMELERCKGELNLMMTTDKEQKQTIHQLTAVRDKLVSECRQLRGKLSKQPKDHVSEDQEAISRDNEIAQLRQQNTDLHDVIRQMRTELETIAEPTNQIAASYVQYMERELQELKSKNRDLEVKVQSKQISTEKPPRSPSVDKVNKDHVTREKGHVINEETHRSHVIALSDTIATLQRDKSSLETQLSQCQAKVGELEVQLQDHREKLYTLKSYQVPQSKVHQKLVHATHVIIALLREKEQLSQQVKAQSLTHTMTAQTQTEGQKPTDSTHAAAQMKSPQQELHHHQTSIAAHSKIDNHSPLIEPPLSPSGDFPPLRFTDSSLGSLDGVLAMVEQELTESDSPRHTSTPTGSHVHMQPLTEPQPQATLELVGHRARGTVRPAPKFKGQPRKPLIKKNKRLVRNYNVKD